MTRFRNSNTEKYYKNLFKINPDDSGHTYGAIRLRDKDFHEEVRVYILIGEKPIKAFQAQLSDLYGTARNATNFGIPISYVELQMLCKDIQHQYKSIPCIDKIDTLGWQFDEDEDITGFVSSEFIGLDKRVKVSDIEYKLPYPKGEVDMELLNSYMLKNVVRQIGLLYNLSAPLAALMNTCILFSLSGRSSKGKTKFAHLAQSQTCSPKYTALCKTLHGTDNATETATANIFGLGVLLDDTSHTEKKFNWTQLIYWLSSGKTKLRLGKNFALNEVKHYNTVITFTTEDAILSKVDPSKEGNVGRLTEISVRDEILFDDDIECLTMERYSNENYGITLSELVKSILDIGIDEIKGMVCAEDMGLRTSCKEKGEELETVVNRHYLEFAILRVTARLANKYLGYKFQIEEITDFLIQNASESLEDTRDMQAENIILTKIYPEMCKIARINDISVVDKLDGLTYYFFGESKKLRDFIEKYPQKMNTKLIKNTLWESKLLYKEGGAYSVVKHIPNTDNESKRGLWIVCENEYEEQTEEDK